MRGGREIHARDPAACSGRIDEHGRRHAIPRTGASGRNARTSQSPNRGIRHRSLSFHRQRTHSWSTRMQSTDMARNSHQAAPWQPTGTTSSTEASDDRRGCGLSVRPVRPCSNLVRETIDSPRRPHTRRSAGLPIAGSSLPMPQLPHTNRELGRTKPAQIVVGHTHGHLSWGMFDVMP